MIAGPAPARLSAVVKRYRSIEALRGISLEVREGEIVALLGPNGAGKTTAIRIMLGQRRPDAGEATLFGCDPRLPEARQRVGATPQDLEFPMTLRVREIVDFAGRHFRRRSPPDLILSRFGLADLARRQAGGLSGGERRRLAVALAFVGEPRLVFLDEPTTGLDVESRLGLWDAIRAFRRDGGTALLTTHHLEEAEALASRIVLIAGGRIVTEGRAADITAELGLTTLEEAFLRLTERAR